LDRKGIVDLEVDEFASMTKGKGRRPLQGSIPMTKRKKHGSKFFSPLRRSRKRSD